MLGLGLKHRKVRASVGLKNELGLTPCKAQQVGLRAFLSLGTLGARLFKHRTHMIGELSLRKSKGTLILDSIKKHMRLLESMS